MLILPRMTCSALAMLILLDHASGFCAPSSIPQATKCSGAGQPPLVEAQSTGAFLSSIGINTHVDQGYNPASYVAPIRYMGIRDIRDGDHHIASDVMISRLTGARFAISDYGDLAALLSNARILAKANALLAIEGPNEPNNFSMNYQGHVGGGQAGTWLPVAQFQRDLYADVKADSTLAAYPVFGPSETGAEPDNVGLQYLIIPPAKTTLLPAGTRFADYANVHNYVSGNGHSYADNQAWLAADPVLNDRWDGLYGDAGVTWHAHYRGYSNEQLLDLPRVTTETGWDTAADPGGQYVQGAVITNTYLAQFKRGWRYTFVYELQDGEGGGGAQGLYHGTAPKLAAVFVHNLTSLLAGSGPDKSGSLAYSIPDQPATVHDLLLEKPSGERDLIIWDERSRGTDAVTVNFGETVKRLTVYDITVGTKAIQSDSNISCLQVNLSNHADILEIP